MAMRIASYAGFLLLGLGFGLAWDSWKDGVGQDSYTVEIDRNSDGVSDEYLHYKRGILVEAETDRDHDGIIDASTTYNTKGSPSFSKFDDDFNETFESFMLYDLGVPSEFQGDLDEDGEVEHIGEYEHGVIRSMSVLLKSKNTTARVDKHHLGNLVESRIDTNLDGTIDTHERYDFYGRVEKVSELSGEKTRLLP